MKIRLLLLILLTISEACKKDSDPAADAASRVAGTYTVTRLLIDAPGTADDRNLTLPFTQGSTTISATFDAAKVTETAISLRFTLRVTGQGEQVETIGNLLEIRGNELFEGTTRLGTADGKNLNLDVTENGTRTVFESRKQ